MKTLNEIIEDDDEGVRLQIVDLQSKAEISRNKILNGEFDYLVDSQDQEKIILFVSQFIRNFDGIAFFPDDALLTKLKKYGFTNTVLKWFTELSEITEELNRLRKIEGVLFELNSYLFAVTTYIQYKMIIDCIETFGLSIEHGKQKESNIFVKYFDNFFRRIKYHKKKNQIGKIQLGEKELIRFIKKIEKQTNYEIDFESFMIDCFKGDFKNFKKLFTYYHPRGLSQNKIFLELFPLIKLTFKDKVILTEEEFDNLPEPLYGGSYEKYKISRVKKILNIK